jgi:myo-inositol-1(or 4)-monophosphatase
MTKSLSQKSIQTLEKHAIQAALDAGKILRQYFGKTARLNVQDKKNEGIVTEADLKAEQKIIRVLAKASQDFGFLGEETGETKLEGKSGRWIIDPLDGTTNFAHGFPMFCVSIAAEWEGHVEVGVIYHPILDQLYVAKRGRGASLNRKKIQVSQTRSIPKALFTTGFAYQFPETIRREMRTFELLATKARGLRRPGSAALDLAYVAQGVFDGFWEMGLKPWDIAAGSLLVIEAGGKISGYQGAPFNIDTGQIVASNPWLFQALIQAMNQSQEML